MFEANLGCRNSHQKRTAPVADPVLPCLSKKLVPDGLVSFIVQKAHDFISKPLASPYCSCEFNHRAKCLRHVMPRASILRPIEAHEGKRVVRAGLIPTPANKSNTTGGGVNKFFVDLDSKGLKTFAEQLQFR
jgi:hypothetical protein